MMLHSATIFSVDLLTHSNATHLEFHSRSAYTALKNNKELARHGR
jgi:hypothetical protein